jgi:hypothetical protein
MKTIERRLLILSCSKKKRSSLELLPAIERYDGPLFRVLRRSLRIGNIADPWPDVFILSAEFGLIAGDHPTPVYDRQMNLSRADELLPSVRIELAALLRDKQFSEIFIAVVSGYISVLRGIESVTLPHTRIIRATGGQGSKARQLKQWLSDNAVIDHSINRSNVSAPRHRCGRATIRGRSIALTLEGLIEKLQPFLNSDREQSANFRNWYVEICGQRISPKWLVSKLLELPVSEFSAGEARRVLTQLGVEIKSAR